MSEGGIAENNDFILQITKFRRTVQYLIQRNFVEIIALEYTCIIVLEADIR